jgi:anti-anti-sigma factor
MKLALLSDENGLFHVECSGAITVADVQPTNPLDTLLGPGCYRYKLLLNFEQVTFLDTGGVSWLIHCHKECQEAGGVLVIHSAPPIANQVFRLLHMQDVLHLAADEAQARELARGVGV